MKKILLVTAIALSSMASQAATISGAGGVSWEQKPTSPNFETTIDYTQWWTVNNTTSIGDHGVAIDTTAIDPTVASFTSELAGMKTPELVGAGHFALGNGVGEPNCANCELTFTFGGFYLNGFTQRDTGFFETNPDYDPSLPFDPVSNSPTKPLLETVPVLNTDDAWLNLYLGDTADQFDESLIVDSGTATTQVGNAIDGDLWLSMSLHEFQYTADASAGSEPLSIGSSTFYGSVVDGISAANFESNFFLGIYDASAFGLTSSFLDATDNIVKYSTRGSGNVQAETVTEPATLAIFGLGLLGLAGVARRKQSL
jgi:hypothetical protein